MKTAAQVYSEVHAKYGVAGGKADKYDIEAMETYAAQFKTKPCVCIQQEIDLKNIEQNGYSNNG